jgi:hypothetical protein
VLRDGTSALQQRNNIARDEAISLMEGNRPETVARYLSVQRVEQAPALTQGTFDGQSGCTQVEFVLCHRLWRIGDWRRRILGLRRGDAAAIASFHDDAAGCADRPAGRAVFAG